MLADPVSLERDLLATRAPSTRLTADPHRHPAAVGDRPRRLVPGALVLAAAALGRARRLDPAGRRCPLRLGHGGARHTLGPAPPPPPPGPLRAPPRPPPPPPRAATPSIRAGASGSGRSRPVASSSTTRSGPTKWRSRRSGCRAQRGRTPTTSPPSR